MQANTQNQNRQNGKYQCRENKIISKMKQVVDDWKIDNKILCELIEIRTGDFPSGICGEIYEKKISDTSGQTRLFVRESGESKNKLQSNFESVTFNSELFSLLENCDLDSEML